MDAQLAHVLHFEADSPGLTLVRPEYPLVVTHPTPYERLSAARDGVKLVAGDGSTGYLLGDSVYLL